MFPKRAFLFLISLVILFGCTNQSSTTPIFTPTEPGVYVYNLSSSDTNLIINEQANVEVTFLNNGDFDARNLTSIIYGYGFLEKVNELNFTKLVLKGKKAIHLWTLKAPVKLTDVGEISYKIGVKSYYLYNFSTLSQVAFVPPEYVGEGLKLSSVIKKSPLIVKVSTRNPVRTFSDKEIFSLKLTIKNIGSGDVSYFKCSYLDNCNKNNHINELRLTVPKDWEAYSDELKLLEQDSLVEEQESSKTYILNYDILLDKYKTTTNNDKKQMYKNLLNDLWLSRGEESYIVFLFTKQKVSQVSVDNVFVSGEFGYSIDTSDFNKYIVMTIRGN